MILEVLSFSELGSAHYGLFCDIHYIISFIFPVSATFTTLLKQKEMNKVDRYFKQPAAVLFDVCNHNQNSLTLFYDHKMESR